MTTTSRTDQLTGTYVLDPTRSRIGFVVRSTKIIKVRGHFERFDGELSLDGDDPTSSAARIVVQASSVRTGNRRRDDHLRRAFLAVADHPAISFTSTAIANDAPSTFTVTGDLTIRGVTRPVAIVLELDRTDTEPSGELRIGFVGHAQVHRKDWGVRLASVVDNGSFMISDRVDLQFEITAVRRP